MTASDYVRAFVRRWPLVLALFVIGLGVGYVTSKPAPSPPIAPSSSNAPPSYQASSILNLPAGSLDPTGFSLDSMAFLATSGPVATMTASAMHNVVPVSNIRSRVSVTPKDTLGILVVTATEATPAEAATVADTFGTQLIAYFNARLLASWHAALGGDAKQITTLSKVLSALRGQASSAIVQAELSQVQGEYVSDSVSYQQLLAAGPQRTVLAVVQPASLSNVTIIEPAVSSSAGSHSVVGHSRKKLMLLGGVAGLLVGLGLALVLERLDDKIRTRDQAERVLDLPVLGELPSARGRGRRVVLLQQPMSAAAESYRMLQTALMAGTPMGRDQSRRQVILLSAPYEVDGKDQVLANLAASFSEAGSSVALLALDSFDRSLPELVSGGRRAARRGSPALANRLDLAYASGGQEPLPTVIEGVSLVLDGVHPGIGNGRPQRHLQAIAEARQLADVVLIDTPPVLLTHDAAQLSSVVDVVVLMCPVGEVKAREASRAAEVLRRVGAPLEGLVLVAGEAPWRRATRLLRGESRHSRGQPDVPKLGPLSPPAALPDITAAGAASITALDSPGS